MESFPPLSPPDATVTLEEERQGEVEGLALLLLLGSPSITPFRLADQAKISWFAARDILRRLVEKGHATALKSGRFARSTELKPRANIDEMRRAIVSGAGSSSLISRCFGVARARRLSREATYVLLAYEALVRLDQIDLDKSPNQEGE
jgi:hypothetical protein